MVADLEWKVVWVGSAKSEKHDQVLDEVEVPPEVKADRSFEADTNCQISSCWIA